jgi:hypothetical protein
MRRYSSAAGGGTPARDGSERPSHHIGWQRFCSLQRVGQLIPRAVTAWSDLPDPALSQLLSRKFRFCRFKRDLRFPHPTQVGPAVFRQGDTFERRKRFWTRTSAVTELQSVDFAGRAHAGLAVGCALWGNWDDWSSTRQSREVVGLRGPFEHGVRLFQSHLLRFIALDQELVANLGAAAEI